MKIRKLTLGGSKKKKTGRRRFGANSIVSVVAIAVIVAGGAVFANRPGPVNSIISKISGNPPLVQPGTTSLLTVKGLANSSTILVKFKPSASASAISAIHSQSGSHVKKTIPGIGVQEVSLPAGKAVGEAIKQYSSHSEVEYAEPDFLAQRFLTPNDTLYAKQWNLAKVSASSAWDVAQGGYGPVAVVDTGIDASHPDLTGEVSGGYNFVDNSANTSDDNGHGTHVAGIIAGTTNNATGIASLGFRGSLMPVKVLDSTGTGTYGDVASGIVYAADHGARIINMSLGGSSASQTLQSAVNYAEQKGVLIVAAAGNSGNSAAVYPADYAGVIAVSATTDTDNLASFSSFGSHTYLSAPGVNITSTYTGGGYATMSGTSMAAPEVTGLISLALSYSGSSTSTVLNDLKQTSDKVGPYAYDSNGWNQYFGYGRINAAKLLQVVGGQQPAPSQPVSTEPAPSSVSNGQTVHGQAGQQFSVAFEGTVDSINLFQSVIVVKVQSISQNLKPADNNLINVYVDLNSSIKSGNHTLILADLTAGDKIGGKALWQNNQLTAASLIVQGSAQTAANAAASHNTGRRR